MKPDQERPVWFWALMALAALKVLVGAPGLLLPETEAGPFSPFPWWVYLATLGVYTAFAGLLLLGGRRDARAVLLGGVFLLAGSMAADRGLARVAAHGPALVAGAAAVMRALDPGAFRPLLVWLFACAFPRDALRGLWRQVAFGGRLLCGGVGIALFGLSVATAAGVLGGAAPTLPAVLQMLRPDDPSRLYWLLITPLTLAGTPLILLNMRAAGRSDHRRAEVFVAGLLIGTAPILAESVAEYLIPAYGRLMAEPTPRFWSGMVLYPLLYGGLAVSAYAVYTGQVLSVRLVVRKAVRYAMARATLIGLSLMPFPLLAWLIYQQRDAPLRALLTGPRQLALLTLTAVALLLLRLRRPLLRALDRQFFREQYDSRQILASLIESGRSAGSLDVLANHVTAEIDRALHVSRATLYLIDTPRAAFRATSGRSEPLPARATLATLLSGSDTPMDIGGARDDDPLLRLPVSERAWLEIEGYRLLVPIPDGHGGLAGLIGLGQKRSELPFSREDRWLLAATASSAALAIARLRPSTPSPAPSLGPGDDAIDLLPHAHLQPARECLRCGAVHPPGLADCPTCDTPLHDAAVPLHVHGLVVERRLGAGGMGVVYGATDIALRRQVAVKTLPAVSMGHARQLKREARAMAAMSHPNLATIYAVDVWRGTPLLLVEYLQGGTLQEALRAGPLTVTRVLEAGVLLASAMAHMHDHSILHCDIKPSNIGFTSSQVPKLLDFGLATIVGAGSGSASSGLEQTTSHGGAPRADSAALLIGTPAYFSPELAALHPADYHSDLWALALTLYEAISGTNPFAAPTPFETFERVATVQPRALDAVRADCPPEVAAGFALALSRHRDQRPPTARAFGALLETMAASARQPRG